MCIASHPRILLSNFSLVLKTLRWGILLDGTINRQFVQGLKSCSRSLLVGIACQDMNTAELHAKEWDIEKVYSSYVELFSDDRIDAVYIAIANSLHSRYTMKAAQLGKHCLVENPLATKVCEIIEIERLAKEKNVIIAEGYPYLYHPQFQAIKQEISSGCIGDVSHMHGIFDYQANNNNATESDVLADCGALWNVGCYPISLMIALMSQCPQTVSAIQQTGSRSEDTSTVGWMKYDTVMGSISTSLNSPTKTHFEIAGTNGRIHLHNDWCYHPDHCNQTNSFELIMKGEPSKKVTVLNQDLYRGEILSFEATVLDKKPSLVTLQLSKKIAAVLEAMYESARLDGVPVVPQLRVNSERSNGVPVVPQLE
uniref:Trans-1,2-dihydrobenzene-1,2-diol dehydrogenase n=1 Tax=Saccoglossus kowalevskii TaxID=10224 RepID=A0ABM0MX36_SACKO|nr:PREDICTED: uncharacterized oxidoreductase At4g09670-like [Saccoglossus kowalevskii]